MTNFVIDKIKGHFNNIELRFAMNTTDRKSGRVHRNTYRVAARATEQIMSGMPIVKLLRSKSIDSKAANLTSSGSTKRNRCFICSKICTSSSSYEFQEQMRTFKNLVLTSEFLYTLPDTFDSDDVKHNCGSCFKTIQRLCDMQKQLGEIQKEINEVVQRTRAALKLKFQLLDPKQTKQRCSSRKILFSKLSTKASQRANEVTVANDDDDLAVSSEEDDCFNSQAQAHTLTDATIRNDTVNNKKRRGINGKNTKDEFYIVEDDITECNIFQIKVENAEIDSVVSLDNCSVTHVNDSTPKGSFISKISPAPVSTSQQVKSKASDMEEVENEVVSKRPIRKKRTEPVSFNHNEPDSDDSFHPSVTSDFEFQTELEKEISQSSADLDSESDSCGIQKPNRKNSDAVLQCFECGICNESFNIETALSKHLEDIHQTEINENVNKTTCTKCEGTKFSSTIEHYEEHHLNITKFKCRRCNVKFYTKLDCQNHCIGCTVSIVSNQRKRQTYLCDVCNINFKNLLQFANHQKDVHLKPIDDLTCSTCQKSFVSIYNKIRHEKIHGIKPYVCATCDKPFVKKSDKERHEKTHSTIKPHVCSKCGKRFLALQSLQTHEKGVCCEDVEMRQRERLKKREALAKYRKTHKPFRCSECAKAFIRKSSLDHHLKLYHTVGADGKLEKIATSFCEQCGEFFRNRSRLRDHKRRVHNADDIRSKHSCQLCGKGFLSRRDCDRHSRIHNKEGSPAPKVQKEKLLSCDKCDNKFSDQTYLKQHILNVHEKVRKFFCKDCNKGFYKKYDCIRHERTHSSGEKPFQCLVCEKRFTNTYSKIKHENRKNCAPPSPGKLRKKSMRPHRRYQCQHCEKNFSRKSGKFSLKEHIANVHENETDESPASSSVVEDDNSIEEMIEVEIVSTQ